MQVVVGVGVVVDTVVNVTVVTVGVVNVVVEVDEVVVGHPGQSPDIQGAENVGLYLNQSYFSSLMLTASYMLIHELLLIEVEHLSLYFLLLPKSEQLQKYSRFYS